MTTLSATPAGAMPSIGRFRILRLLGRGNQSEVYLAHDPHLDRQVAIKTLLFAEVKDRAARMQDLLREARTVSRLSHPNIIALHDAGEHQGQPYLVFEYVQGRTLAEVLRESGPLSPPRAVEIAVQVLDAIACAHAQGIVHRDLKPSNILLDEQGVARVMDFGIATRIAGEGAPEGGLMGTPAYMAPEYVAGGVHGPRSDVYGVGLVLYEMLTGRPAIQGGSVQELLEKVTAARLPPPSAENPAVDERLDDIVLKAIARDPETRWHDAAAMRDALEGWLAPRPAAETAGAKQSTLEFLLRRMRLKSDFPALSEAISTINRIAGSDQDSVSQLSNAILKDFGLTNKLLKVVNSVSFVQYGGGNISTVSRAVVILGFNAVRNLAISLVLFENLQNKAQAAQLKEEFIRVLFSGMLAREMAGKAGVKDGEEAFICAMFHNLGRLLCLFYFPEESEEIRRQVETRGVDEDTAASQVLGLSFEELGMGIAKSWGLPEAITQSMRRLPAGRVRKGHTPIERLRILAGFSNELAQVIADGEPAQRGAEIERLSQRFGESLALNTRHLAEVVTRSLKEVREFSTAVNANFGQTAFARRADKWLGHPSEPESGARGNSTNGLADTLLAAPGPAAVHPEPVGAEGPSVAASHAALVAGLQEISNSLVNEDLKLNDILRMILETMYSAMGFHHVLFCMRDVKHNAMQGKFGFGEGIAELAARFRFPLTSAPDVFHVALEKNVDILITDIDDPKITARIPEWYRQAVPAKTFVIFPVLVKGKPVGLIYADKAKAGDIVIPEQLLSTLKALRNQAVLAIRQNL